MAYEQFKQLDAVKHDRTIKPLIGMSRAHFDTLTVAFAAVQLDRLQQGEIKQIPSGGPKGSLDSFDKKLFFLLYYLKNYPVFDVLGFHFGLSGGHAHTHVIALLPVLRRALWDLGVLPERSPGTPEEFAQLIEQYGDMAIDGMACPCVRPRMMNSKKPASAEKTTPPVEGHHREHPAPANAFPLLLFRRQPPRLGPHEKDF